MSGLDLSGKRVVVTGEKGLGGELVRQATEAGAEKVMFSYCSGAVEAQELHEATGATFSRLALGDLESHASFLEAVRAFGPVDLFVANAGMIASGRLKDTSPKQARRILDVNLFGNIALVDDLIVGDYMAKRGRDMAEWSRAGLIGSVAAGGHVGQRHYAASKRGLRGYVESLPDDMDVRRKRVGVCLLEPAFVDTGNPDVTAAINYYREKIIAAGGADGQARWEEFVAKGYVMKAPAAAEEVLRLMTCPEVVGVRAIPEGATMAKVREYLNKAA